MTQALSLISTVTDPEACASLNAPVDAFAKLVSFAGAPHR